MLKLLGGGAAAVGLPASTVLAQDDADDRRPPSVQPIFTSATERSGNWHEETVTDLLNAAAPDSSVYFTIYNFTRDEMVDPFLDAADRGVDVNLLIDDNAEHKSPTMTLLDELPDRTQILVDGGIGDNHNHNKFLLLEELENGDRNVVWQSSQNFTGAQLGWHNTSVVVRNDPALYEAYRGYWEDMADPDVQDLSYNRTERAETATAYFSPRDDYDTHLRALENVVPTWQSKIHFIQSIWTESREEESRLIQDRLTELIDEGAEVKVIMAARDDTPPLLEEAGAEVVEVDGGFDVHSKTMLIDSDFETEDGEVEHRREVWTGSQNLSRPGLRRNEDTVLRFVDDDVYDQFLLDWERMYYHSTGTEFGADGGSDTSEDDSDAESTPEDTETAIEATDTETTDDSDDESDSLPGFGMVGALGALGGGAAASRLRRRDDSAE